MIGVLWQMLKNKRAEGGGGFFTFIGMAVCFILLGMFVFWLYKQIKS